MVVEVVLTPPSTLPARVSQELSLKSPPLSGASQGRPTIWPQRLLRQDTILQSPFVEPTVKYNFQPSAVICGDHVKALKLGQKKLATVIRGDFQQRFTALQASVTRNLDLQLEMRDMQRFMLEKQQQTLGRFAAIQGRIQVLLKQTFEMHEYPITRLFIVLPKDINSCNSTSILNNHFQLHFLCECGEHTKVLNGDNTNIPHHIHLSKHEGYDLQRPKEFFRKYGR